MLTKVPANETKHIATQNVQFHEYVEGLFWVLHEPKHSFWGISCLENAFWLLEALEKEKCYIAEWERGLGFLMSIQRVSQESVAAP